MLSALVQANATANGIGHMVSGIGEAINVRLLQLAEAELGPPPVPSGWPSGGTLARCESTAHWDQDNCLLRADDFDPRRHGACSADLARRVFDGIDTCGHVSCPDELRPQVRALQKCPGAGAGPAAKPGRARCDKEENENSGRHPGIFSSI